MHHTGSVLHQSNPNLKSPAGGKKVSTLSGKEKQSFPLKTDSEQMLMLTLPPRTVSGVDRAHFHRQPASHQEGLPAGVRPPAALSSTCPTKDPEGLGYQLQRDLFQQQRLAVLRCMKEHPDRSPQVQIFRLQNGRPIPSDQGQATVHAKEVVLDIFTEADFFRCRGGNDPVDFRASQQHHEPKTVMDLIPFADAFPATPSLICEGASSIPTHCEIVAAPPQRTSTLQTSNLTTPKTPSVFADAISNMELHITSSAASQCRRQLRSMSSAEPSSQEPGRNIGMNVASAEPSPVPLTFHSQSDSERCGIRFGPPSISSRSASEAGPTSTCTPTPPPVIVEDDNPDSSTQFKVLPVDLNPKQPLKSVLKSLAVKRTSAEMENTGTKQSGTISLESGFTSFSPSVKRRLWPTNAESSSPALNRVWSSAPTELVMHSDLFSHSSLVVEEATDVVKDGAPPSDAEETVVAPTKAPASIYVGHSTTNPASPDLALLNASTELLVTVDDEMSDGRVAKASVLEGFPLPSTRAPDPIDGMHWTLNDTVESLLRSPVDARPQVRSSEARSESKQQIHHDRSPHERGSPKTRAHVFAIDATQLPTSLLAGGAQHPSGFAKRQPSVYSLTVPTIGMTLPLKLVENAVEPWLGFPAFVAELGEVELDQMGNSISIRSSASRGSALTSQASCAKDQSWLMEALLAPEPQRFLCYESPLQPRLPGGRALLPEAVCAYICNESVQPQGSLDRHPFFYVLEAQCQELQRGFTMVRLPPLSSSLASAAPTREREGSFLQPLMEVALSSRSCNAVRFCLGVYLLTVQRLQLNSLIHGQLNLRTMFLADTTLFYESLHQDVELNSHRCEGISNQNETVLFESIGLGAGSVALDSRSSAFHDEGMSAAIGQTQPSPPLERLSLTLGLLGLHKPAATITLCCCSKMVNRQTSSNLSEPKSLRRNLHDESQLHNPKGAKRSRLESPEELPVTASTQIMTEASVSLAVPQNSTWIDDDSLGGTEAAVNVYSDLEGFVHIVTNEVSLQLPTALSSLEWKWVRMLSHEVMAGEGSQHTYSTPIESILQPLLASLRNRQVSQGE